MSRLNLPEYNLISSRYSPYVELTPFPLQIYQTSFSRTGDGLVVTLEDVKFPNIDASKFLVYQHHDREDYSLLISNLTTMLTTLSKSKLYDYALLFSMLNSFLKPLVNSEWSFDASEYPHIKLVNDRDEYIFCNRSRRIFSRVFLTGTSFHAPTWWNIRPGISTKPEILETYPISTLAKVKAIGHEETLEGKFQPDHKFLIDEIG